MPNKRYYHASKHRFKVGDYIIPGGGNPNYGCSCDDYIYLTTDPCPHYTVIDRAITEGWYVYEVKPIGKLFFGVCWDELYSSSPAEVVNCIGNARGLIKKRHKPNTESIDWYQKDLQRYKDGKFEVSDLYILVRANLLDETIEPLQASLAGFTPTEKQLKYLRHYCHHRIHIEQLTGSKVHSIRDPFGYDIAK